jgi:hypothetical protein
MKEVESNEWLIRCAKSFVFKSAAIAAIVLSTLVIGHRVKWPHCECSSVDN